MKYTKGSIGRVFVIKFENGEDLNAEMEKIVKKEKIRTGFFFFLGGMDRGDIVSGPKKPVIPPDPYMHSFGGAWEVFGTGSIFSGKQGTQVHIHISAGKKKKALTGCLRKNSKIFITTEAVLYELKGVNAVKEIDAATGVNMLKILSPSL